MRNQASLNSLPKFNQLAFVPSLNQTNLFTQKLNFGYYVLTHMPMKGRVTFIRPQSSEASQQHSIAAFT